MRKDFRLFSGVGVCAGKFFRRRAQRPGQQPSHVMALMGGVGGGRLSEMRRWRRDDNDRVLYLWRMPDCDFGDARA